MQEEETTSAAPSSTPTPATTPASLATPSAAMDTKQSSLFVLEKPVLKHPFLVNERSLLLNIGTGKMSSVMNKAMSSDDSKDKSVEARLKEMKERIWIETTFLICSDFKEFSTFPDKIKCLETIAAFPKTTKHAYISRLLGLFPDDASLLCELLSHCQSHDSSHSILIPLLWEKDLLQGRAVDQARALRIKLHISLEPSARFEEFRLCTFVSKRY